MIDKKRLETLRNKKSGDPVADAYTNFEKQLNYLMGVNKGIYCTHEHYEGVVSGINVTRNGLELILGEYTSFDWASWLEEEEYILWKDDPEIFITNEGTKEDPEYWAVKNEKKNLKGKQFLQGALFKKKDKYLDEIISNVKVSINYDNANIKLDDGSIVFKLDTDKIDIDMITGKLF